MKICAATAMFFASAILRQRLATSAFRIAAGPAASSRPIASTSKIISYAGPRVESGVVETVKKKKASSSIEERPRKGRPHPRNSFQGTYDMERLVSSYPPLGPHVTRGPTGRPTVPWADPAAVLALNTALLVADYRVHPSYAEILPPDALVPPVPGRADYVHHLADALQQSGPLPAVPVGPAVIGMDIGTGASCIYPTLATATYGWRMIATDINPSALMSARNVVKSNDQEDLIDVRGQEVSDTSIFDGVLRADERIDFTMCNPPFYPSREAFRAENARKLRGLSKKKGANRKGVANRVVQIKKEAGATTSNNFGGIDSELWCEGGEVAFVERIILESKRLSDRCLWFSSLVSRKENLTKIESFCYDKQKNTSGRRRRGVQTVRRVPMGAGQKSSTIIMWSFLDEGERRDWAKMRGWG